MSSDPQWLRHPQARSDLVESEAEDRANPREADDGWAADRQADREADAYWRRFD